MVADAAATEEVVPVYFRGTSRGFPGSPALQKIGIAPASTDTIVATIFAVEGQNFGEGVIYIATAQDLAGVLIEQGNVLAKLEAEVAVNLTPLEFANKASITITAVEARNILVDMGISIPGMIRGPAAIDTVLRNTPRLTSVQITQFVDAARNLRRQP